MVRLVLVGPTYSDNLVSLTQLTKVGAIFAFTRCRYQLYATSCYYKSLCVNRPYDSPKAETESKLRPIHTLR